MISETKSQTLETAADAAPTNPTAGELRMSERELAQLISRVERGDVDGLWSELAVEPIESATVVGVTGPPGSGKSTLVDALARAIREQHLTVAILAIDPSSHRSGGAVLGDRVRMSSHSQDPGIYIRSMGTRGSNSGLARATRDSVRLLQAAGYDIVIVETVGVGQVELDVLSVADIVTVVMVPGLGDTMQMNKAGIMEIGDLFVVNMADRPETARFVRELKQALALGARHHDMPPVCRTIALSGEGVEELWQHLTRLDCRDRQSGRRAAQRRDQLEGELHREIEAHVVTLVREAIASSPSLHELEERVVNGQTSPKQAAQKWLTGRYLTHGSLDLGVEEDRGCLGNSATSPSARATLRHQERSSP